MGLYKHTETGRVAEVPDHVAALFDTLVPAAEGEDEICIPCMQAEQELIIEEEQEDVDNE